MSLLLGNSLLLISLSLTAESARCSLLVCERVERRSGWDSAALRNVVVGGSALLLRLAAAGD